MKVFGLFIDKKPKKKFLFFSMKINMAFTWGSIYFCTMDGFFRILKKALSELICTQLYITPIKSLTISTLMWVTKLRLWVSADAPMRELAFASFLAQYNLKTMQSQAIMTATGSIFRGQSNSEVATAISILLFYDFKRLGNIKVQEYIHTAITGSPHKTLGTL